MASLEMKEPSASYNSVAEMRKAGGLMMKIGFGLFGWLVAATGQPVPHDVRTLMLWLFPMALLDMTVGIGLAGYLGQLKSRMMINGLVSKAVNFGVVLMVAFFASDFFLAYWPLKAGLLLLYGYEFVSISETLTAAKRRGIDFGPANTFLERIGRFFAEEETQTVRAVAATDGKTGTASVTMKTEKE